MNLSSMLHRPKRECFVKEDAYGMPKKSKSSMKHHEIIPTSLSLNHLPKINSHNELPKDNYAHSTAFFNRSHIVGVQRRRPKQNEASGRHVGYQHVGMFRARTDPFKVMLHKRTLTGYLEASYDVVSSSIKYIPKLKPSLSKKHAIVARVPKLSPCLTKTGTRELERQL
jgi:hypothetical protein